MLVLYSFKQQPNDDYEFDSQNSEVFHLSIEFRNL